MRQKHHVNLAAVPGSPPDSLPPPVSARQKRPEQLALLRQHTPHRLPLPRPRINPVVQPRITTVIAVIVRVARRGNPAVLTSIRRQPVSAHPRRLHHHRRRHRRSRLAPAARSSRTRQHKRRKHHHEKPHHPSSHRLQKDPAGTRCGHRPFRTIDPRFTAPVEINCSTWGGNAAGRSAGADALHTIRTQPPSVRPAFAA